MMMIVFQRKSEVIMYRLKVVRLSRRMTQWALSQAAEISQGRYSMLERGLVEPTPTERERIAQVLQVPASSLFRPALRERSHRQEVVADAS